MDRAQPVASAAAVKQGLVLAVGDRQACAAALGKGHEPVDLRGRAMLPGFIDTHMHPVTMVFYSLNCDVGRAGSMADLQKKLSQTLARKTDNSWLAGLNFDEQSLHERRVPLRQDLDEVSGTVPIIVIKHDGHSVFTNTAAIQAAGLAASTPDPDAGTIEREADGYPSGAFREEATQLILSAMPIPDLNALIGGARNTFNRLASLGLTSAGIVLQTGDEGPAGAAGAFDVMAMQLFSEHCPLSLYSLLVTGELSSLEGLRNTTLASGANRLGGIKLFADGTFGSSTAWMHEPFFDSADKKGMLMHTPEELYGRMAEAHNAGWQVCVHAIGDAANQLCVELYGRLFREFPRNGCRHRIEHASILDRWTIEEMARLGVVVSTQPMFIHSEKEWLPRRLGMERCKTTYPYRDLLDAGVVMAGASDGPIESPDVLHAIQCCVTREGFQPHQCITLNQALRMYTIDAAFAQFEENKKGSITPGKRADIVILSQDPFKISPDSIKNIGVEETIAGGKTIFIR